MGTLVAHPNGAVTPADEPAVVAARAPYHHAAGYGYGYAGPLHVPTLVAHPNGAVTPVDEPAVAAARADHLAAHGVVGGVYAAAPYNYAAGYAAGYAPYAGLVAHPNGAVVPVDEPAVAAARAEHFAAKAGHY